MKLLIVAATRIEVEPLIHHFGLESGAITSQKHDLELLITGVGMVATAYALGRQLAGKKYDLAINAGIAGSFGEINIGEVVLVKEDHFSDLGAESDDKFLTIDTLGFGESRMIPVEGKQVNLPGLKLVKGITVNTVHGNTKNIETVIDRLNPEIETMEGAAFFYACNNAVLPSVQIRAISNIVEKRNPGNWNINLAIKSLNDTLIEFINQL